VTRPAGIVAGLALAPRGGTIVRAWPLVVDARLRAGAGAATLELVDVRGRVLARADVEASGAVELAPGRVPAAGLYFVRLVQGVEQVSQRVVRL